MNYSTKTTIKRLLKYTPQYVFVYLKKRRAMEIDKLLLKKISYALNNVSYYKSKYGNVGKEISLSSFEYLKKSDVIGNESIFVSRRYIKKYLLKSSTGGTTGLSLNLYRNIRSTIYHRFFSDLIFGKIDSLRNLKIAVLRGNRPKKGIYEYKKGVLLLSSYDLNLQNAEKYLDLIKKYNINCIHAYPSSLMIFCSYIKLIENKEALSLIKGIITSSETISRFDKKTILQTFINSTLIDIYGQNERVALAYSINLGFYKFVDQYSFVELKVTNNKIKDNQVCEIIGTSFINNAMPLIRYKTEDFAEVDKDDNVVSILGRTQDVLINRNLELLPCIILTRDNTLKNVISFQYYQDKVGEFEFRVTVNDKFNDTDEKAIIYDINKSFNYTITPTIVRYDKIDRLPNGKQKRLIQLLDVNNTI